MPDEEIFTPYILTADIGGTHITAAVYNTKTGFIEPDSLTRAEVNSKGTADEILSSWSGCLKSVLEKVAIKASGITLAMPGPFDYDSGISYIKGMSKYESIFGMDIKSYLADALDINKEYVLFRNDAESTIAGEALSGAGKDYKKVIGITLGTGFGSAFADYKVTKDLNLGSDPYRNSIADDYFSTRWFVKRYHELSGKELTDGVRELASFPPEDAVSQQIFNEFTNGLAGFLAQPIEKYRPEVLVICGNIAKSSRLFLPRLKEKLTGIDIKLAELDENAPLIGAAATFKDYLSWTK